MIYDLGAKSSPANLQTLRENFFPISSVNEKREVAEVDSRMYNFKMAIIVNLPS